MLERKGEVRTAVINRASGKLVERAVRETHCAVSGLLL